MNLVFTAILIASVVLITIISPDKLMPTMLTGATSAMSFSLKLFLIYAIWMSALKVFEKSGADKGLAKALNPVTKRLFSGESDEAYKYINLNLSANMLGMGGAATPMGIKSIETIKEKRNKIMLVVVNSTSIQLVPTTILALRAELNAATDIMLATIIVNVATTLLGIILVRVFVR